MARGLHSFLLSKMSDEIDVRRESMQGRYANYCQIGQNGMEFVIDFGERYGEQAAPLFHTRIVTTPVSMKAMVAALVEAVEIYERRFPKSPEDI
jgi:hypothetical protein